MSNPKNTVNGAGWMRRGAIAAAAIAMAFTALSAAPSSATEVADEEAAYGRYYEQKIERVSTVEFDRGTQTKLPPMASMRGGGWA